MKLRLLGCIILSTLLLTINSCKKNKAIDEPPAPDTNGELLSFTFSALKNESLVNDIMMQINGDTIRGRIKDAQDIRALIPDFTISGGTVFVNGVEQESGKTAHDFTHPVTYEVKSEAGTIEKYTVIIDYGFPILNIQIVSAVTNKTDWIDGTMSIEGNIDEADAFTGQVQVRGRGNSTFWLMPKKPLKIKLEKKEALLGMTKNDEWVLLANFIDVSLIRTEIAFEVSRALNMTYTPETRYVEVVLNGDTLGNYQLVLPIERARVGVEKLEEQTTLPDLSGGYLVEIDGFAVDEPAHRTFFTPRMIELSETEHNTPLGVTIKYPKQKNILPVQHDYIEDYFVDFETALFSPQFTDPDVGYRKYFDVASYVDYYLVNEIAGNPDMYWSTYMYKFRNDDKMYTGPVWDFDIAFNNDIRVSNSTYKLMRDYAYRRNLYANRLMEDPQLREAVKNRWNEKKGEIIALTAKIDKLQKQLKLTAENNLKIWPELLEQKFHVGNQLPESYDAAVEQVKGFFTERLQWLDEQFNDSNF